MWTGSLAALVLLLQVDANAHVASGAGTYWCSPHDATVSQGGSSFDSCNRDSTNVFSRYFFCDNGTPCSDDLCPSGGPACGWSASDGSTSHGKKGGHAATIFPKTLQCSCIQQ